MKSIIAITDYGSEGRWAQLHDTCIPEPCNVWEEPAHDFEYVMDMSTGMAFYRHKRTGKTFCDGVA